MLQPLSHLHPTTKLKNIFLREDFSSYVQDIFEIFLLTDYLVIIQSEIYRLEKISYCCRKLHIVSNEFSRGLTYRIWPYDNKDSMYLDWCNYLHFILTYIYSLSLHHDFCVENTLSIDATSSFEKPYLIAL